MNIYYSPKFAKEYKRLSSQTKKLAEKREKIFRINPFHPSLKTHKLTGHLEGFWSFSINYKNRIVFEFVDANTVHFHSVGTHQIYKQ